MPKGGARTRSGPAREENALRRDRKTDQGDWLLLPAEGRTKAAPAWPLMPRATPRETAVWRRLWKKPQAVAWEQLGMHELVALYCRRFCEAEQRMTATNLSTLVRQLADGLGLTAPGMASLRWRIVADETAEKRGAREAAAPKRTSSRDRLRVVRGSGG